MLAGMIAEPAFLSEYTIFALDHSKRPKTAQVASVVSLPSLPVSPSWSFSSSSSSRPVPSSCLCDSGESVEDCGSVGTACSLICLLFPLDLVSRRHLTFSLTLPLMGILVFIVWARACVLYCLTSELMIICCRIKYFSHVMSDCLLDRPWPPHVMLPDRRYPLSPQLFVFEELIFCACKSLKIWLYGVFA